MARHRTTRRLARCLACAAVTAGLAVPVSAQDDPVPPLEPFAEEPLWPATSYGESPVTLEEELSLDAGEPEMPPPPPPAAREPDESGFDPDVGPDAVTLPDIPPDDEAANAEERLRTAAPPPAPGELRDRNADTDFRELDALGEVAERRRAGVGVPSDDGDFLPAFSQNMDPVFQMEGLKFRLWEIHGRLSLASSFRYDDNIFERNVDRVADYITTVSPIISLGAGNFRDRRENYFVMRYQPQLELFAINSNQDTVNEFFNAQGQYEFSRLVTNVVVSYRRDSNPNEDQVGRQQNNVFNAALNASYAITGKTFLQGGVSYQYFDRDGGFDYNTYSANFAIAYQYSPKLRFNLGPYAGITFVEDGGEQPFQGITAGVSYSTLAKLDYNAFFGFQARQFRGSNPAGNTDFVTPIFGLGLNYRPTQTIRIGFGLSRDVQNSGVVRGQSLINNRIRVTYTQRILGKFDARLNTRYDILQYQGSGTNDRTDQFLEVEPSIGYAFLRDQMSLSVFYRRRERWSEIFSRNFYSNTFGARVQVDF